jgi:hypothetical protein
MSRWSHFNWDEFARQFACAAGAMFLPAPVVWAYLDIEAWEKIDG